MVADRSLEVIPLEECRHRHIYRLQSRNLALGVFNRETRGFIGIREKFGDRFLFTEYHWDTGAPFGTANPYEDMGELPEGIELRENDPPVDVKTGRRVEWRREEDADSGIVSRWYYIDDGTPMEFSEDEPVFPVTATYRPLFDFLDRLESDRK